MNKVLAIALVLLAGVLACQIIADYPATSTPEISTVVLPSPTVFTVAPTNDNTDFHVYVIQVESVNIRSGPGAQYAVIGNLRTGDEVKANCQFTNGWCKITQDEWVLRGCLTGESCEAK